MKLRNYQLRAKSDIEAAWKRGHQNVCFVLATGGGKTVIFAAIAAENAGPVCLIAHRQELVGQISLALCRQGVPHRLIGPKSLVRFVVAQHKGVFYDPRAPVAVASIDTLVRRADKLGNWLDTVTLWIQDECHHIQKHNKWGRACELMPRARGLGVTAEPSRSDGGGLGRQAEGVFDVIVEGPGPRELIKAGWLTDYEIVCPGGDIDLSKVQLSPQTGDYSRPQLRAAVRKSKIVGHVVINYLRFAIGKLGITFATDVETASELADQYNKCGVPAAVVSHKTRDVDRARIIDQFRRREILQLCNCDIFCEGFDLPAVEVVSMARPTESFGLYLQQFGRALRPLAGKRHALIIDHVSNVERHGLPDWPRPRSLGRRASKGRMKPLTAIPLRVCLGCTRPYLAALPTCPHCGAEYIPDNRTSPQFVDGDLGFLNLEALAGIRARVAEVDKDPEQYRYELAAKHCPGIGQLAHVKRHVERQRSQEELRQKIASWCELQLGRGKGIRQIQREFFYEFGIDVLTARTLNAKEAKALAERVNNGTN